MASDFISPTISLSSTKSRLSIGDSAVINFVLSEPSTDFTLSDVTIRGGVLSNFTGSGISYTATFTSTSINLGGSIDVRPHSFTDLAGNWNYFFSESLYLPLDKVIGSNAVRFLEVESNDSTETATPVNSGTTYYGQLSSVQDEDIFVFEAANGGLLSIAFDNPKYGNLFMGPYFLVVVGDDAHENALTYKFFDTEDKVFNYVLPSAGKYYIGVGNPGGLDWGRRPVWTDDIYSIQATFPSFTSLLTIQNSMVGNTIANKYGAYESVYTHNGVCSLIYGTASANNMSGTTRTDYIAGYEGNDLLNGYEGIDHAMYRGRLNEYVLSKSGSSLLVSDSISSRDDTDTLSNIERLHFTDTNIALDVGPTQNAGSVYMLYKAAFNRAPDAGGMGYWLSQKDVGLNIVTNIAQGFVGSPEFTAKYGTNPSNASYVDKLYQNVLGRAGEAGGVAYWNQQLDAGNISKAAVLVQFATLSEGASLVANLIANGIAYQEYVG